MQKILIVEDDIDIQELLRNFLQEVGYEISIANDGMEAISLFSTIHFDLILLDIMLPKIDGFTVCELIRSEGRRKQEGRRRVSDGGRGFCRF